MRFSDQSYARLQRVLAPVIVVGGVLFGPLLLALTFVRW